MVFAPPSEGAQFQPQNSADPTSNFLSLLLALFPPGTEPLQAAQPQPQESSLASAESVSPPLAVFPPSLLTDEEIAEADRPAPSEEPDNADPTLLLSFLSSLLWVNTPPAAVVEAEKAVPTGEKGGKVGDIASTSGMSTFMFLSGDEYRPGGESGQAEGVSTVDSALQPALPPLVSDEMVQRQEPETLLRVHETFESPVENPDPTASVAKPAERLSGKAVSSLPPSPVLDTVAANPTMLAGFPQKDRVVDTFPMPSGTEAPPSFLAPSLQKGPVPTTVREKQPLEPLLFKQEEIALTPPTKSSTQVEALLREIQAQNNDKIEHILPRTFTSAEQALNTAVGHITATPAQVQASEQGHHGNIENWQAVVNQVADSIVTKVQENSREAHLQLSPPELGRLDIQIIVEGERVQAHIVAESKDVGALIQSHLPELKQALQGHRLDLENIRVDVQTNDGNLNSSSQQFRQDARSSGQGQLTGISPINEVEDEIARPAAPLQHSGRISVWA